MRPVCHAAPLSPRLDIFYLTPLDNQPAIAPTISHLLYPSTVTLTDTIFTLPTEPRMNRLLGQDVPTASSAEDLTQSRPTIVDLFQAQVVSNAFSTALEVNNKSLSYASLGSRVDRLARDLRSHGVGYGDIVALCLKRTENLVIGMLAVLKAGAAYLPLNPSDPAYRLGQILSHAASRFIVTDSQSMTNLPDISAHVWVLDREPAGSTEEEGGDALSIPQATDIAYVIYTSGTTGNPKGVAVTHGALSNVFTDTAQRIAFTDRSSWLALTTVCFDIAALELLLPLCFGGKVILVSEEQARIGRVLAGIIHHKKPTVMQATPITWRILVESGWAGSPDLTILCGGDRLDRELANKLVARSAVAWNMYGPTETTIWSTAEKLSPDDGSVTIGQPIANTEIYILDAEGQPQVPGEVGEICIGGAGLSRGYVKDPQLTREYFIELRSAASQSTRVYRTGDLGRWNNQGKLEFHGRIDHQVKINGFRIEVQEIETAIRSLPGVADVAVAGVVGATNQKRLYAFFVPEPNLHITLTELVSHLIRYLPKYMIPEKFWSLDNLPSTPNGKRDTAALEALARVNPELR
jgi:amino acid adenylation domain-containing protein